MTIEKIIEILRLQDDIFETYKGCSDAEIKKIESAIGRKLPGVYRIFLAKMGKEAGNFMVGSSAFYEDIPDLREAANELLEENSFGHKLPEDAFVFWMHQGYQVAFFIPGTSDDPTVFYYGEGEELKEFRVMGSLTDFLTMQLRFSGFEFS